jgi:zinc and cadmium transporter
MAIGTLAVFSISIVVASVLGGLLPLATLLTHTRLQAYLSFAAGVMLGAAFFHMLPEAVEPGAARALAWTAAGLLGLFFLERFFSFHHHEAPADPERPCPTTPHEHEHGRGHAAGLVDAEAPGGAGQAVKSGHLHWRVAAFGLTIHSLIGGVSLASAALATGRAGPGAAAWGVFLATVVHKPADALTIVSLMLRAGVGRPVAYLVNLLFALMIPAGMGLFLVGMRLFSPSSIVPITSAALAFSAGTFLCIALSDLLPELQFHAHDRFILSAALLAGVGLMAAVAPWG